MPDPNPTVLRPALAALVLLAAVTAAQAIPTPSAAANTLRVERGDKVVTSLQPEDFPPPPGAPISPLRLTEAPRDWPDPIARRRERRRREQEGPKGAATCSPEFNASIVKSGERSGRLSRIQMSLEPLENPRRVRYRWRLARGVERCKYRIYLGSGPSLTTTEPTHMDSRTGYYDNLIDEDRRYLRMIVWGRTAERTHAGER